MTKYFSYIIAGLIITMTHAAFSQQPTGIYIGQRADSIQTFVGQEVQGHYNSGGWLVKMNAQTIDYKGKLKEIILCKENVLMPNINKGVNFCIHYVMANDTLAKVLTEYKNLSLDEVKQLIIANKTVTNMTDGYYFNADNRTYSHLYIAVNGKAVVEYKKTILSQLPLSVQELYKMLNMKW